MISVRFEVMYGQRGMQYWGEYQTLDRKFWEEVEPGDFDLSIAHQSVTDGTRGYVLAFVDERLVGFHRFDPGHPKNQLGATYIEREFRGKDVCIVDTPWLRQDTNEFFWNIHKAAYLLMRWIGYGHEEIGSFDHNEKADRVKVLREDRKDELDRAVENPSKPTELLDKIMHNMDSNT